MLIWRKKEGWQGLYKLLAVNSYNIILNLSNRPVKFRLTIIWKYFWDNKNFLPKFSLDNRLETNLLPALKKQRAWRRFSI